MRKVSVPTGDFSFIYRTLKAVYIWIVLALVWMGLELLLYGEIQPRTVDDIMWFLFLPFIYMAVN